MFKVIVPSGGKGYIFEICDPTRSSRPKIDLMSSDSNPMFGILSDDMHKWLEDFSISYSLIKEYENDGYSNFYILFENKNEAALFKLTWS